MTYKDFSKRFNRASARVGMSFALFLVQILPHGFFCLVMRFFAFCWFSFARHLRKVARDTLTIAFGETHSPQQIKEISRQCFENIGRSMMELIFFAIHPTKVTELFILEGREYLDAAVQKNQGVILVTAHFGNFPLMLLELSQLGYRPSVIIRKARDAQIAEKIYKIMAGVGVETIYSLPARASVKRSLEVLRDKGILCVLLDQNYGAGSGVFVDFFGRKAATATGPVVLAQRTGAPLVLCFTIREGDKYRVVFEPEFKVEDHPDPDEMLLRNVSRITATIERYIRKYPAEWGWMHRRWKTQQEEAAGEGAHG